MLFKELFGKSPIEPLQMHMKLVREAIELLQSLFEYEFAHDQENQRNVRKKIMKLEYKADLLKETMRDGLPTSFMMPIKRNDILNLLNQQDNIIDTVEDIAIVTSLKDIELPEDMQKNFFEFLDTVNAVYEDCYKLVDNLDELLAASFAGPEAEGMKERVDELEALEWETDKRGYQFSKKVFAREDEFTKGQFYIITKTIVLLGKLADKSEKAAKTIRMFLVR